MTSYFVNSLQEVTANNVNGQNLTGTDNLYVSATGDIVALGTGAVSGIYLDANSTGNTVDIAGQVYCANGDGIDSHSPDLNLTLTGSVSAGEDGIYVLGQSQILIGSQGVLSAGGYGIIVDFGAGDSTITVDGSILSADDSGLDINAPTTITVNAGGIISGNYTGVTFYGGSAESSLYNGGTIRGDYFSSNAIFIDDANIQVDNAGTISSQSAAIDITAAGALIQNSGTISGQNGTAIQTGFGANGTTIDNSGTILGTIWDNVASGPLLLTNSGTIHASTVALATTAYNDTVSNSGTIHGSLVMGSGMDTISNDGKIAGSISFNGTDDTLGNSGSITGGVTLGDGDTLTNTNGTIAGGITGDGGFHITNSGTITGGLSDSQDGDTLDNSGTIVGTISLDNAVVTNSGLIHGNIFFASLAGLTNDGTIAGSVTFNGAADNTLTNNGTIHGLVTLGAGDSFVNTGAIHGNLDLGTGDTLTMSTGTVAGEIVASTSDTFDFSGQFGHYQIADFAAFGTHHTGYDVIDFASDEFTSYTELQTHMAQEGSDVVITLDATDDIVLIGTKLTQLNAHDFLFT